MNSKTLNFNGLSVGSSMLNVLGVGSNLTNILPAATILSTLKLGYEQLGPVYLGPGSMKALQPFSLPTLTVEQRAAVERAKKFAMEQSVKAALEKQNLHPQFSSASSKKAQTLNLLSRIYVGSISYDLKEDALKKVFTPFGPIRGVNLSWDPDGLKHKGFAFIEFEYPEAAYLSIQQMNNTNLGGRQLKVGRPSNLPNAEPLIEESITENKLEKRIYIAGVHTDLSEEDLSLVFEAFGKIVFCKLIPDPVKPKKHRGFGYIEYESVQPAIDAVASMNMFDLGGQFLRVGKAIAPLDDTNQSSTKIPAAAAVAAASVTAKVMALEVDDYGKVMTPGKDMIPGAGNGLGNSTGNSWDMVEAEESSKNNAEEDDDDGLPLERQENMYIRGQDARNIIMQKLIRSTHGVVVLRNMVGPEDIDDDLENEVREECSTHGAVEKVQIHQELDENGELIIKIFVVFADIESANRAIVSLTGRYFAKREVLAELYDSDRFDANDLTG